MLIIEIDLKASEEKSFTEKNINKLTEQAEKYYVLTVEG